MPHRFDQVAAEEGGDRMVTVQHISYSPRIRYLHRLLAPHECEHIVKIAQPLFSRSPVRGAVTRVRTSTTAMLPAGDPVVKRITARASYLTGYPYANIEPLQLVKYTAGQRYEPHFDYGEACDFEENMGKGHRHVTMLVYLNNLPAGAGGHTTFPKLNVQGDPIEVRSTKAAVLAGRDGAEPLQLGSVKANCGHGEPAARPRVCGAR